MLGIFDSGSGGLTILRALTQRLPDRDFCYLGDHARAPYGIKTSQEIFTLTINNVVRLFDRDCELVLLACNTASAVALRRLQQEWLPHNYPDRRVLGLLVPMVEAITDMPWDNKKAISTSRPLPPSVAIFATPSTVASGAYPFEINLRAPNIHVVQQACEGLVRAIEENAPRATIRQLLDGFVEDLRIKTGDQIPHTILLGCTHYHLIANEFAAALPDRVHILPQPDMVAASFGHYLQRHPEFGQQNHRGQNDTGARHFLTTGDPTRVNHHASHFFGRKIEFEKI